MAFSDPAYGNFGKKSHQSGNEATFHQHQRSRSVSRRWLFNHLFKLVCCILTDDFSLKAPVLVPSALTFPLTDVLHYCQRCRSNVRFKDLFFQPGMKNQWSFLLSRPHFIGDTSGFNSVLLPGDPPPHLSAGDGCRSSLLSWPMNLADGRYFDPWRRLFPEHLGQIQFVSLPREPVERACISLLIELMEVFLEQGEFQAWKLRIICAFH